MSPSVEMKVPSHEVHQLWQQQSRKPDLRVIGYRREWRNHPPQRGDHASTELQKPSILPATPFRQQKLSPTVSVQYSPGFSGAASSQEPPLDLDATREVELAALLRHVLATGDAQYLHARVVPQVREELGRDEKVL